MEWAQILVIILAIFLAIFLLLAVILVALLIKVTQQIKSVAASAERTAHNIEGRVSTASKLTTPLTLVRMFMKRTKESKKR